MISKMVCSVHGKAQRSEQMLLPIKAALYCTIFALILQHKKKNHVLLNNSMVLPGDYLKSINCHASAAALIPFWLKMADDSSGHVRNV